MNKQGLNFQNNRNTEAFGTSFAVCESYGKLAKSVFQDYEIKADSNNSHQINDYEDNISNMRIRMRAENYLNSPMNENEAQSFNGRKLCEISRNKRNLREG